MAKKVYFKPEIQAYESEFVNCVLASQHGNGKEFVFEDFEDFDEKFETDKSDLDEVWDLKYEDIWSF